MWSKYEMNKIENIDINVLVPWPQKSKIWGENAKKKYKIMPVSLLSILPFFGRHEDTLGRS